MEVPEAEPRPASDRERVGIIGLLVVKGRRCRQVGRANPKTRSILTLVGRIGFTKHPGEARPKPNGFGTRIRDTPKGTCNRTGG